MRLPYSDNKYLMELAKSYPNRNAVSAEVINLNAILNMPKGTEHFLSDIHGEHEAFLHIRKNASGVIRKKIKLLFDTRLTEAEIAELATLIYYPEEKLDELRDRSALTDAYYLTTVSRLIEVCRLVGGKYTRSKMRKHLEKNGGGFEYIIEELLNCGTESASVSEYHEKILNTVIKIGAAESIIVALADAIKSLVIDHLHIVGDIFDRGPRADIIVDELMREQSIDVQWGNHDVLWLGAAAGSRTCIATVLNNSITYKNLDVVEIGYGISLRPLALFASEVYGNTDVSRYMPKGASGGDFLRHDDDTLIAKMHKAISIIQFKLEGQAIMRNPEFDMDARLLLDKINRKEKSVTVEGKTYPINDVDFPTVDENEPYALTEREAEVMRYLKNAFMRSEKLQRHAQFLYEKGEMYTVYNKNLLFHGCIPLEKDGSLMSLAAAGGRSGKELMDYCDEMARKAYFLRDGSEERRRAKDFIWFLWCGKNSPLCAREKITTFERLFIDDKECWHEPKNTYYHSWDDEKIVDMILKEFSLGGAGSYIINGHIPVTKGETPIKANGRLIVIDGGFCKAYQSSTGIGGYTLIYNSQGMSIAVHEPFRGRENAIKNNVDVISDRVIFKSSDDVIRVKDTDNGARIREKICDLMFLLSAYEDGSIKETGVK